jgi:hypothetical protein
VLNEFGGAPWYPSLFKVATGSDAHEGRTRHAPDDRIWKVDASHSDRQINPVFHHVSHEVRENEIHFKARIER